jgi:hypothetical protein
MPDTFREGARSNDPLDTCPGCGGRVIFASDFKKFGKHSVRVCIPCKAVYVNGEKETDLIITEDQ